ncbi:hypothetical protein HNW77_06490 [Komagataeibacter sp. AV436]|uniref:Uncharacterized protein n=1 Tax=Komagataeibacter melomenusus TaxID=2766578 RepID=A0ABX2ACG3_9PROT|nr:hypothetical protein [Komagataeibacter melomenusus]MBV1830450.1 hypothetical protein [Komagataeibacter melomenusus]NPC66041.1 hypothetical protein [Komagataeibacter melomenusus]
MIEHRKIEAITENGSAKNIILEISTQYPWFVNIIHPEKWARRYEAPDLFSAFQTMRLDFEKAGICFLCIGARPDVMASGMSRNMSGGRKVYVVRHGEQADRENIVDIFDYAPPDRIGTVKQQQDFATRWLASITHRS